MVEYHPRTYWTQVAERIQARGARNIVAGDDTPFFRYQRARFLQELAQIDFQGKSVLEVGCGPGGNLEVIHATNPTRLVGCDISWKMIGLAAQNLQPILADVELVLTDGVTLPFKQKSMDIVYTVTVLQHNTDEDMLVGLMREICKVARDKVLLFEETSVKIKSGRSWVLRPVGYYQAIMEEREFKLTEVKYLNVFFSHLASVGISRLMGLRDRQEGEPLPALAVAGQRACLPLTRPLDRLFTKRIGLTKMSFEREDRR